MRSLDSRVLADIRSDVCDTVLKWTAVIGLVAVLLSLLRIFEFGFLPVMALHVALVGVLSALYLLRKSVPYVVRASAIIAVMMAVAAAGHVTFGVPMRLEFFIAASIMAAVFFGERVGVLIIAAGALLLGLIYAAFRFELLPGPVGIPPLSPTNWLANAASMVVAALAPLLAVHRYSVQLNIEHQRVAAANQAKATFLATMSHELRTPMTAILGMSDLLLAEQPAGPVRDKAERISKAGRLLLDLLTDVLDFSKMEANAVDIQTGPFKPHALIKEICGLFAPLAAEKGVTLSASFAPEVAESLIADAGRLRQAVLNLVGNAVKFTDHGRIDVGVRQERRGHETWLEVEVADTGLGIPEAEQARLFQPFVQLRQQGDRRTGGTGLGLAISRRFVELMGGTISLRSMPHKGSAFTITIPVEVPAEAPAPARASAGQVLAPRSLRLLVAEDDDTIRFLLQAMLQKWGHRVDTAANGLLAVEAVRAGSYDAVLMDMQMPEMDGASAARAIRGMPTAKQLPIIAVTAEAAPENRAAYLSAGITTVLGKPVKWDELSRLLNEIAAATPAP